MTEITLEIVGLASRVFHNKLCSFTESLFCPTCLYIGAHPVFLLIEMKALHFP